MSFMDAVRSVLSQYATFSGRARRSEFWWFGLFAFLAYVVAYAIDQAIGTMILTVVVWLGLIVPTLAVSWRRLHDTGRSGAWWLIGLVPVVGGIILIVFYVLDSQPGDNQYGPSPKQAPMIAGEAPAV